VLEPLLGSTNRERVLLFLAIRGEAYPSEMAKFFQVDSYLIRKQLDKLERGGILSSRQAGRTRLYSMNPRYPFLPELKTLLEKALSFYPEEIQDQLLRDRRRPRRRGKPL
jgi:predicted transcriptional regulator